MRFAVAAATLALLPAVVAAAPLYDPAARPRWSALLRQVAKDRDAGVAEAAEHHKLAEIVAADKAAAQPYLIHDDDDEFYLWITVAQVYEHAWYTPSKVEEIVQHDCTARLEHPGIPNDTPKPS
jgi:hypothetical protein